MKWMVGLIVGIGVILILAVAQVGKQQNAEAQCLAKYHFAHAKIADGKIYCIKQGKDNEIVWPLNPGEQNADTAN